MQRRPGVSILVLMEDDLKVVLNFASPEKAMFQSLF